MSDHPCDKLVEIPCSEWHTLRDIYLRDWPTHIVGYSTIDNYVRWTEFKSDFKQLHIYSLNGDWQHDGTFFVVDRYQVFFNTINLNSDSIDRITRALMMLDWRNGLVFLSLLGRHRTAVLQTMYRKQLTIETENKSAVYYMPRAEAATLEIVCPDGISLRPMSQKHAVIADDAWPFQHQGSLFFLSRLIAWNVNIGAFTNDGKLVAWIFQAQTGSLTNLQVDSNYKRMGLGTLLIKSMAKKLSELDKDTHALVVWNNFASRLIFDKTGFKLIDYCDNFVTKPLVVSAWKDLD